MNEWQSGLEAELDVLSGSLARLKREAKRGAVEDSVLTGLEERTQEVHRMLEQQTGRLRCAECERESQEGACGWRAFHSAEDDDAIVAVILCPECAEGVDEDA